MTEAELREIEYRAKIDRKFVYEWDKRPLAVRLNRSSEDVLRLIARVRELEGEKRRASAVFSGMLQILKTCVQVIRASEMDSKGLEEQIECFEKEMSRMEGK